MVDDVPVGVKKRRNNELLAVQNEVALLHHQAIVGRTVEVLVEGKSRRTGKQPVTPPPGQAQLVGRTGGDHIVVFDGPLTLVGRYIQVHVTGATALTLFGVA